MAEPGSEDPLMTDIWQEFKYDYTTYVAKAKQWTKKHATCVDTEGVSREKDKFCENSNNVKVIPSKDMKTKSSSKSKLSDISNKKMRFS